jgi:mannose-1-phosphate guanylyltransferase
VSHDGTPKQCLPLVGVHSTFQRALARASDLELFAPPLVPNGFRFLSCRQAEELRLEATIMLELREPG